MRKPKTSPPRDYLPSNIPIKSWAEEDRPREKLLLKGRHALSDAELLAILLGSGSTRESAVTLAQRILQSVENDLDALGRLALSDLMKFRGVGQAKAVTIAAALELGRRRQLGDVREKPLIRNSTDAFRLLAPLLADLPHEEFWMLFLNRANRVLARERLSIGGQSGTIVDAKILFRKALEHHAAAVILCHNHPSGNLQPSPADIQLTKKLLQAGKTLDIAVLDHLIVAGKKCFSFADEGLLSGK